GEKIAEQGEKIAEQGRQIAEQGRQIALQGQEIHRHALLIEASMKDSARIAREVADNGRTMVGRFKLMDQRFAKFLDALEKEVEERAPLERLEELEERVRKLEERMGPAA